MVRGFSKMVKMIFYAFSLTHHEATCKLPGLGYVFWAINKPTRFGLMLVWVRGHNRIYLCIKFCIPNDWWIMLPSESECTTNAKKAN